MAMRNCRKFDKTMGLYKKISFKDKNGITVETWEKVIILSAYVWNIHGSELLNNLEQYTSKTYKRCQIRYKKYLDTSRISDVTNKYRIVYRESVWDITSIDVLQDDNKIMELLLKKDEDTYASLLSSERPFKTTFESYIIKDLVPISEIRRLVSERTANLDDINALRKANGLDGIVL